MYIMQAFKIPDDVLTEVNRLLFRFFWRKKDRKAFELMFRLTKQVTFVRSTGTLFNERGLLMSPPVLIMVMEYDKRNCTLNEQHKKCYNFYKINKLSLHEEKELLLHNLSQVWMCLNPFLTSNKCIILISVWLFITIL